MLFRLFSAPGSYFVWSGANSDHFGEFLMVRGPMFEGFSQNFLTLKLANAVAFCNQDSSRNGQGSLKILAETAKILIDLLYIRKRQECSGVRRSSRK